MCLGNVLIYTFQYIIAHFPKIRTFPKISTSFFASQKCVYYESAKYIKTMQYSLYRIENFANNEKASKTLDRRKTLDPILDVLIMSEHSMTFYSFS